MQPIQTIDVAAIIVTIFFFALGSYFDLKMREVDDKVWLAYAPIGLTLTIARILYEPDALLVTLASIGVTTLVSLGLLYFGLVGGADSKAVICLGLTMPLPPTGFQPFLGYVHPFFPPVVVITSFLCSASVAVWLGFRNLATYVTDRDGMFQGLRSEARWRKLMAFILGYRAEISKLRSTFYLYPMEEVVDYDGEAHRSLKLYLDAETDRDPAVSVLSDSLSKIGYQGKVWVTPGLPMLLFILMGFFLTLLFGDALFATVLLLAKHR